MKNYNIYELKNSLNKSSTTVVLYGAGSLGKIALGAFKKIGVRVDFFCDYDINKHGKRYCGIEVISPERLINYNNGAYVFISTNYLHPVISALKRIDIDNIYDCVSLIDAVDIERNEICKDKNADNSFEHKPIDMDRIFGIYKSGVLAYKNKYVLNIKHIDIVVTEKCSMKCVDCSNLMQYYSKPIDSDIELLFNSMDAFMACVDHVFEFRVIGGEPFMNKQLGMILNHLSLYDNVDTIVVYTNATIMPKSETLESLKNSKVKIDITNYHGLSRNYDNLLHVLDHNNIDYIAHCDDTWTDSGTIKYRARSDHQLKEIFSNCCVSDIWTLLNGILYHCPFSANAHNLTAIPCSNTDSLDIISLGHDYNILKRKISDFMLLSETKGFLTACNFCGGRDATTPIIPSAIQTKAILEVPMINKSIK